METGESLLAPELVRRHRKALHAEAKGVAAQAGCDSRGAVRTATGRAALLPAVSEPLGTGPGRRAFPGRARGNRAKLGRADEHEPSVGEGHDPG